MVARPNITNNGQIIWVTQTCSSIMTFREAVKCYYATKCLGAQSYDINFLHKHTRNGKFTVLGVE